MGAPVVFMLLLFLLQQADYARQNISVPNPPTTSLAGVFACQVTSIDVAWGQAVLY